MARHYILQDWQNAAEYSGQMIGDRLSKSSQLHFKKNGMANIDLYADEDPKKKTAKKKSAFEQITLADRHYQRMENLALQLDTEYEQGYLSDEDYIYAIRQIEIRKEKAWVRLCKVRGWSPEQSDQEEFYKKDVDNNQEQGLSFSHELIDNLSDGNCFKIPLQKLLTAKEKMVKILEILKS